MSFILYLLLSWFLLFLFLAGSIALSVFIASGFWAMAGIAFVLFLLGVKDYTQKSHSILRNFPLVGQGRYIADWLRPKIYQYFVEPALIEG